MIEYFNLTPGLINDNVNKNGLTISLCPFRYIKGSSLLVMLKQSKRRQQNQAFLLDKLDMLAIPIVTALNIPSFSCITADNLSIFTETFTNTTKRKKK